MIRHDLSWSQMQERTRSLASSRRLEVENLALSRSAGRILASHVARPIANGKASGDADFFLHGGLVLTPVQLSLAASLGVATLPVSRKPSVAVYTVGDDLVAPGMPLPAGHRFDSARELLMGLLRADGLEPTAWPRLPDEPAQLEIAVRDAACAFDLVIVCGDRAVNDLCEVVSRFGRLEFGAMQADSDLLVTLGCVDQAFVLGVPTDSLAVMVAWMTLGRVLVDGMQGRCEARTKVFGRLASPLAFSSTFAPVRVEHVGNGDLRVVPSPTAVSLETLAMCDGLAVLSDVRTRLAGDVVEVLMYA